jgi:hypothetical protein
MRPMCGPSLKRVSAVLSQRSARRKEGISVAYERHGGPPAILVVMFGHGCATQALVPSRGRG